MEPVVVALVEQHTELDSILAGLDDDGWGRPTPCEGWTVADVVLHLAQTNEMAGGSLRGRFDEVVAGLTDGVPAAGTVDAGADLMVARDRGRPPAEVHERWRHAAADLQDALERCDPSRRVQWVAGELAARTLAATRIAETWIHTTDVATAVGQPLAPTDRLWWVARLAWRTLPYAFARAGWHLSGPVAFHLAAPSGEAWTLDPDEPAITTISGEGAELCLVAGRRLDPARTGLRGEGPDTHAVLELVRTYA